MASGEPKKVGENTDYSTEITKMTEFETEVNEIETQIKGDMSTAETALNEGCTQLFENNWSDEVATIFYDLVKGKILGGITAIEDDEGFSSLKGIISNLQTDLENCKNAQTNYRNACDEYLDAEESEKERLRQIKDDRHDKFTGYIATANADFKKLAGIDFDPPVTSGEITGGASVSEPASEEVPYGTFVPFEGEVKPGYGGKVYKTTYLGQDKETGHPVEMTLLVNTENGNIAYGNDEVGYFVTCVSKDGTVYSGLGTGDCTGIEGAAALITDGHENANGYNGWFWTSPQSTYGFNNSVSPGGLSESWGNCKHETITVGETQVDVVLPIDDYYYGDYVPPYSLVDGYEYQSSGFGRRKQ